MPKAEFRLIERLRRLGGGQDVALGIGDDAAVLQPRADARLVAACDTLIGGVHFPASTGPGDIAWKALAVNLSDLAAMGAEPRWALLALTLPRADDAWLEAFADGWHGLAVSTGVALVGGDMTQGALSVTVTLLGEIPPGMELIRAGARPGDRIAVTGTLGDAALALAMLNGGDKPPPALLERLNRPRPRLAAGKALRGLVNACIDVSDGLAADLDHVLTASGVGARIEVAKLPLSAPLRERGAEGLKLALAGGDDYELCFSFAPVKGAAIERALGAADTDWTEIGEITPGSTIQWRTPGGEVLKLESTGYGHFEL